MKKFLLIVLCALSLSCLARSRADIQMDEVRPYLQEIKQIDKDQYNRIHKVMKALCDLNYEDMVVVYNYLYWKIKISCLIMGE